MAGYSHPLKQVATVDLVDPYFLKQYLRLGLTCRACKLRHFVFCQAAGVHSAARASVLAVTAKPYLRCSIPTTPTGSYGDQLLRVEKFNFFQNQRNDVRLSC